MARIEGIEGVARALRQQLAKRLASPNRTRESVVTGYTAAYALHVHEMPMKHAGEPRKGRHPSGQKRKGNLWDPPGRGQNKFLETPARTLSKPMGEIVVKAARNGATLQQSLYLAALLLQRESQKIVPVDTGNLKASAFTQKE